MAVAAACCDPAPAALAAAPDPGCPAVDPPALALELWLPGGPYPDFYNRILAGDPDVIEVALCFLEVRPYFFRSGYRWKTILKKCKRAPMSAEQSTRFQVLLEKYEQWRKRRRKKI